MAYAVGRSQFDWLADHKKHQTWFNSYMASRREGKPDWFDVYPVQRLIDDAIRHERIRIYDQEDGDENCPEEEEEDNDGGGVFLVDIGGNQGHDLTRFRERFGSCVPGKLILQDLPAVIESVDEDVRECRHADGIEMMGYNFLDPQPVKGIIFPVPLSSLYQVKTDQIPGAKIYYFRSILHDWPDHTCRAILLNTLSAMDPTYSRILIVDFVLSDIETPLIQSSMDIQMMSIGAGVERSERQWKELLHSAGLDVTGIWNFSPGMESVIEAVPVPGFVFDKHKNGIKKREGEEKKKVTGVDLGVCSGSGVGPVQAEVETVWLQRAFGVGRP